MYKRNLYVRKIAPFLGKPVVKVITGMRRAGKSCLVRLLIDKLVADGVRREQIVYIDKESFHGLSVRHLGISDTMKRGS